MSVRIELLQPGRRLGRRCVAPRPVLRRACERVTLKGTLTFAGRPSGANVIVLTGRVGGRLLAPGDYRATLQARDAAGNLSLVRTVLFTILAPASAVGR